MADAPKTEPGSERSHIAAELYAVACVVAWVAGMIFVRWHPSAEEKKDMADTLAVCRLESVCADYPDVRDVCATAGSFEKCMEVKLGSREKYDSLKRACTNDGKVMMDPDKIPGWISCWTARIKG